jgi:hypothetical protein
MPSVEPSSQHKSSKTSNTPDTDRVLGESYIGVDAAVFMTGLLGGLYVADNAAVFMTGLLGESYIADGAAVQDRSLGRVVYC